MSLPGPFDGSVPPAPPSVPPAPAPTDGGSVAAIVPRLRAELAKAIAGQEAVLEQLLVALLADGHVLLEGVPGVAKTLMVRTLAKTLDLDYGRIQFTPDMMPSDVLGTRIFDPSTNDFRLRTGPVFVQILLADEINRTPPKTQAALLEAMEERRVTLDGEPLPLPGPFLVFATQNPIDYEGTYPLPEAQQDRFLMKVKVGYPRPDSEREVLRRHSAGFRPKSLDEAGVRPVVDGEGLKRLQAEVSATTVEEKVFDYIVAIVAATRDSEELSVGASPRASIALLDCAKAVARLRGREFVTPDDVKQMAVPVLRHRILVKPESEIEGFDAEQALDAILARVPVPR